MRKRLGVVSAIVGLVAGSAASAAALPPLVVQCRGTFYDLGEVTDQQALYRIAGGDVQVWSEANHHWISYVCTDRCRTSRSAVTVRDAYTTGKRGLVAHVLDFKPRTGRLDEEWRVGTDLLQFNANCARAVDPAPDSVALPPSTKTVDFTLYSIARGLPLPIPRTRFEPTLHLANASYRSSTSRP